MKNTNEAMQSPVVATPRVAQPVASGASRRASTPRDASSRRLTVGPGLSLSGEISSCDTLIVEGKVDAKLSDGKLLEITESGQFRGTVEIENADIAGRYDGQLTVHGRLTVRSTGRVSGMICYGELEINAGGQIIGEMQVVGENGKKIGLPSASASSVSSSKKEEGNGFKSAAKFASLMEADEAEAEAEAAEEKTTASRRVVVSA